MTTELLSYYRKRRVLQKLIVRVLTGPEAGARFETSTSEFSIGSAPSNQITIKDPSISGHHLACTFQAEGIQLVDLESKNGSFVGDVRIGRCTVVPECQIRLGRTTIGIEVSGETVEEALSSADRFGSLVGNSPQMRKLFALLQRIADSEIGVLIHGETGCGKELVAESLHEKSLRKDKAFVVVDCGAVSQQLIQSELFGHKKGSFTGAVSDRCGAFESADGGTLFLDEIGELPLEVQPVLLRVLDSGTICRVGESRQRKVNVRLVAASNRDLRCEANQGRFREDLYYRLSRLPVNVPPLRERRGDIPALATLFAQRIRRDDSFRLKAELLSEWSKASWPGNVRELRNTVERYLIAPTLMALDEIGSETESEVDISRPYREAKEIALQRWASVYLKEVLAKHDGSMGASAESIGIDRNHLRRLLKRYHLNE